MSSNRWIWFDEATDRLSSAPPPCQVFEVLADYIGDAGTVATLREDQAVSDGFFFVELAGCGAPSYPFRRQEFDEATHALWLQWEAIRSMERCTTRCFTVIVSGTCINVVDRLQDHFTRAVADGFARAAAQFWGGRLELG